MHLICHVYEGVVARTYVITSCHAHAGEVGTELQEETSDISHHKECPPESEGCYSIIASGDATGTYLHTKIHTYTCTHVHMYTHTRVHTHPGQKGVTLLSHPAMQRVLTHACTHTHIHTYIQTHIHTYTHTHIHTYTHTHTLFKTVCCYAYTHTYTYT